MVIARPLFRVRVFGIFNQIDGCKRLNSHLSPLRVCIETAQLTGGYRRSELSVNLICVTTVMTNYYVQLSMDISNPESEIPEVAQLEQPLKTSKNLKSWTLGNVGPFCWKPTLGET
jgi:hypothetical protein